MPAASERTNEGKREKVKGEKERKKDLVQTKWQQKLDLKESISDGDDFSSSSKSFRSFVRSNI